MKRAEQIINAIGEKVIDSLFDVENNDYELTYDELDGTEMSVNISFGYKGCTVDCSVLYKGGWTIECLLTAKNENHKLELLEMAVNGYVENNMDKKELLGNMKDYSEECSMDEFQRNGFSDEADYWRYRMGA